MKKKVLILCVIVVGCFLFGMVQGAMASPKIVLDKALGYILKAQQPDGGWQLIAGKGESEVETTAWATRALQLTKSNDAAKDRGIAFILKQQKPSGSWNDNIAHTAFCIWTLSEAQRARDAVVKAATWLWQVQNKDGGWGAKPKAPNLSIYTAVAIRALLAAGLPSDNLMIQKGVEYLKSVQNKDGGWGVPKGGRSLSLSTAWALYAMLEAGVPKYDQSIKKGLKWLLNVQLEHNGGFCFFKLMPPDPELTAYSLLALCAAGMKGKPPVQDALYYLEAIQLPDGAYMSRIPKEFKKRNKKNTQTTCFVAWAVWEALH
jgi:prenyltransferase beta subunit